MAGYTHDRKRVGDALRRIGVVVVMNADHVKTPEHMVTTMTAVFEAGFIPEVTFRIDAGILREGMDELRRRRQTAFEQGRHFILGVGSIISDDELEAAVAYGFDMLVGPGNMVSGGTEAAVRLKEIQDVGIAVAPAVFTPTELQYMLHNRWGFQPDAVKVFPAGGHGPKGISDLLAPFAREAHNGKIVMPTGAVDYVTGPQYIEAISKRGFAPVLGMSAPLALVTKKKAPGNPDVIRESLEEFAIRFSEAKQSA
jgi:2-keto-3-deoxy-6-phosphogluconate aldolase